MEPLTSYEILALFTSHLTDSAGHFMNFLAVFSACLVAIYLLAGKLARSTLFLLSALLVVVSTMTALGQYASQLVAIDLAGQLVHRDALIGARTTRAVRLLGGPNASLIAGISTAVQAVACMGAIAFACSHAARARGKRAPNLPVENDV